MKKLLIGTLALLLIYPQVNAETSVKKYYRYKINDANHTVSKRLLTASAIFFLAESIARTKKKSFTDSGTNLDTIGLILSVAATAYNRAVERRIIVDINHTLKEYRKIEAKLYYTDQIKTIPADPNLVRYIKQYDCSTCASFLDKASFIRNLIQKCKDKAEYRTAYFAFEHKGGKLKVREERKKVAEYIKNGDIEKDAKDILGANATDTNIRLVKELLSFSLLDKIKEGFTSHVELY